MSLFAFFYMLCAYLLGSLSAAILFCRLFGLPDPRSEGSRNPGATNVLRIGGKWPALVVLIFDMLKGMLPVWAGYYLGLTHFELGMVALAACLGHIFPVFFNFKGGHRFRRNRTNCLGSCRFYVRYLVIGIFGEWLFIAKCSCYRLVSAVLCMVV